MNASSLFLPFLELLAKSVAVMLAPMLAVFLRPRLSAAQRSLVWACAFVVLLLLPATKLLPPQWAFRIGGSAPELTQAAPTTSLVNAVGAIPPLTDGPLHSAWDWAQGNWRTILLAVWCVGVGGLLLRKALGSVRLATLVSRSRIEHSPRLKALAGETRAAFGVRQKVILRASPGCRVPFTWGAGRCVIMLPEDFAAWPASRLQSALRHEFAHIARWDWLTRWAAQLGAILFWPNPLVWFGFRAFMTSQEQACDDRVIGAGTPAGDYADVLVDCVRILRARDLPGEALGMARPSTLETRILAILDENRNVSRAGIAARTSLAVLAACALAVSASAQVEATRAPGGNMATPEDAVEKAKSLRLSKISFQNTPMTEVAAVLQKLSQEADPEGEGLKVHYVSGPAGKNKTLTLSLGKISLLDALTSVKSRAGLAELAFTKGAAVLVDPTAPNMIAPPKGASENTKTRVLTSETIVLSKIEMNDLTLPEAAAYLEKQAWLADSEQREFSVSCQPGWDGKGARVRLSLVNVPLSQALLYVARLSGSALTLSMEGAVFTPDTAK